MPPALQAHAAFGTIFDIGHAAGPILAGFPIARYDYLYAFWFMAALFIFAVPLFAAVVKEPVPQA